MGFTRQEYWSGVPLPSPNVNPNLEICPKWRSGKESACLGEGNGIPLQYFCPENPVDGGAWWAAVHEVARVGHD